MIRHALRQMSLRFRYVQFFYTKEFPIIALVLRLWAVFEGIYHMRAQLHDACAEL